MVKTQELSFLGGGENGLENTVQHLAGLEDRIKSITRALTGANSALGRVKTTVKTVKTEAGRSLAAFDKLEKLSSGKTTTTVTTETQESEEKLEALGQTALEIAGILGAAVKGFATLVGEKLQNFAAWGDGGITAGLTSILAAVGAVQALLAGDTSVALWLGTIAAAFGTVGGEVNGLKQLLLFGLAPAFLSAIGQMDSLSAGGSIVNGVTLAVAGLTAGIIQLVRNFGNVSSVATQVWESVKTAWGGAASWFQNYLFAPLGNGLRLTVNVVIGLLNGLIAAFVWVINAVISALNLLSVKVPDWVPVLGGKTFGFQIKSLQAPEIPYLAKGAVLPANKPFLAMVGDQKHGTNVEAPLSTIQEAVSLVMGEQTGAILSGFEASIGVQREILEAVLGIHIGDATIAQAVHRYEKKMAVVRGGGV